MTDDGIVNRRGDRRGLRAFAGGPTVLAPPPLSSNPPVDVNKSPANAGASTEGARADHKHDAETASAVDLVPGGSSSEGTGTALARATHAHGMPPYGSGPNTIAQGNDPRFTDARAPTTHASSHLPTGSDPIPTGTPVALVPGGVSAVGSSTISLTRRDHVHGLPPFGQGAGEFCEGSDARVVGAVQGPASSVAGNVAAFADATGKTLSDSGKVVANLVTGPASTTSGHIAVFSGTTGKVIASTGNTPIGSVVIGPATSVFGNLPSFGNAGGKLLQDSGKLAADVVTGPAAAVTGNIAVYNGTTGKVVQDSGVSATAHGTRHAPGGADPVGSFGSAAGTFCEGNDPRLSGLVLAGINNFRLSTSQTSSISSNGTYQFIQLVPHNGSAIALYSGGAWGIVTRPTGVELALTGMTAGIPVDIFGFNSAGTIALERVNWSGANTRATALMQQDGVWVKNLDPTRRYLGTILPISATQFTWNETPVDATGYISIWNADNRLPTMAYWTTAIASFTHTAGGSLMDWNNNAGNAIQVVVGLPGGLVQADLTMTVDYKGSTLAGAFLGQSPSPPGNTRAGWGGTAPTGQRHVSRFLAMNRSIGQTIAQVRTYSATAGAVFTGSGDPAALFVTTQC